MGVSVVNRKGFSPKDFGSALMGWWDPSVASSVTDAGSGKCSVLADLSGNARDLLQGTDAARPITGSRTQNGLNVLDYDGADAMVTGAFTASQPNTYFVVAASDINTASTSHHLFDGITTRNTVFIVTTTAKWGIFGGSATLSSAGNCDTSPHLWSAVFNNTAHDLRKDGASIASGSAGTAAMSGGFVIGAGQPGGNWDGWVGEIIGVNAAVSAGDIAVVEAYLNDKWAIY